MNEYRKLIEIVRAQEDAIRFETFSNEDALALGLFLVNRAKEQNLTLSVAVRSAQGGILFHHLMTGTSSNNQKWMLRKFNTVAMWEHSSMQVWASKRLTGETLEDHGLTKTEYVACGGGIPIRLKTGEMVAVATVSNLPHQRDHQFLAEGIAAWLKVEGIPSVEEVDVF